jgi:hypothetical protein
MRSFCAALFSLRDVRNDQPNCCGKVADVVYQRFVAEFNACRASPLYLFFDLTLNVTRQKL